jgi:hypothetical protein
MPGKTEGGEKNKHDWCLTMHDLYSDLRQIPDNQEVFLDMNTQQSLIIELLEKVEHLNEDCAK